MNPDACNLEADFERTWPVAEWRELHVVLAVSGGADSVAMLRAAVAAKRRSGGRGELFAAHLNHGLRGADAAADAEWVAELCRHLEVPLEVGHADVTAAAAERGDGWESAARNARYDFLRDVAERIGARFVAAAHTADDQVETVVHRLIRGTGLAGLAGIPPTRQLSPTVTLVRPLLAVRRVEVLRYLAALEQDFREDATNRDLHFTRNRIRHELLPAMRQFNADLDGAVLRLAQQAAVAQHMISQMAERLARQCVTVKPCQPGADSAARAVRVAIDCQPLANKPPLMIGEVCKFAWTEANWPLQDMGFDQWQQLAALIAGNADQKTTAFPGGIRVERDGDTLVLQS